MTDDILAAGMGIGELGRLGLDETGLVPAADGGRDNLVLGAAIAEALGWYGFTQKIENYVFKYANASGNFPRYPGATDNSVDNMIGAISGQKTIPGALLAIGRSKFYCFNLEAPDKFALKYFYGRFLGFVPYLKMQAGEAIGTFSQLAFVIAMIFSTLSAYGDTSNKILQWLMICYSGHRYPFIDFGIKIWKKLMLRKYPGGLRELFGIYFGPSHVFTLGAPTSFN